MKVDPYRWGAHYQLIPYKYLPSVASAAVIMLPPSPPHKAPNDMNN